MGVVEYVVCIVLFLHKPYFPDHCEGVCGTTRGGELEESAHFILRRDVAPSESIAVTSFIHHLREICSMLVQEVRLWGGTYGRQRHPVWVTRGKSRFTSVECPFVSL